MEVAGGSNGLKLVFKRLTQDVKRADFKFEDTHEGRTHLARGQKRAVQRTEGAEPVAKKQRFSTRLSDNQMQAKESDTSSVLSTPSTAPPSSPQQASKRVRPSKKISVNRASKPNGRNKRCGDCDGCQRPDCGSCQSCRINSQFKDQIKIGRAECLRKECLRPISLDRGTVSKKEHRGSSLMEAMMEEQDDGACPFKMIDGQLVDFRCYQCKKLPRAGCANRSELYRHYSLYHFAAQLLQEYGHLTSCPIPGCSKGNISGKKLADHMGQVHNAVDKFLPAAYRIPLKTKGKARKSQSTRPSKSSVWVFPDIPAGYNPKTRTVDPVSLPSVFVDASEVVLDNFFPIQEPEIIVPDSVLRTLAKYPGWLGSCALCRGDDVAVTELVHHLLQDHAFQLENVETNDILKFLADQQMIHLIQDKSRIGGSEKAKHQEPVHSQIGTDDGNSADPQTGENRSNLVRLQEDGSLAESEDGSGLLLDDSVGEAVVGKDCLKADKDVDAPKDVTFSELVDDIVVNNDDDDDTTTKEIFEKAEETEGENESCKEVFENHMTTENMDIYIEEAAANDKNDDEDDDSVFLFDHQAQLLAFEAKLKQSDQPLRKDEGRKSAELASTSALTAVAGCAESSEGKVATEELAGPCKLDWSQKENIHPTKF